MISVLNPSLPFAALSIDQAACMIREIVTEEVRKALYSTTTPKSQVSDEYEPIFDVSTALDYLDSIGIPVPKSSLYKASASKELECDKIGRKLLFTQSQLLAWLSSKIVSPETKSDAALRLAESARRKNRVSKNNPHNPR